MQQEKMAQLEIELEYQRKQMQLEKERNEKALADQKAKFDSKVKQNIEYEEIQRKMKNSRDLIVEANEIAKLMRKNVKFEQMYIANIIDEADQKDEVRVKVSNYETGSIHVWSQDKFKDKLDMMRFALSQNEIGHKLPPEQDPFYEKQEPILLG